MPDLRTLDRSEIAPDTPLRLDVAAALAFPGGGMSAASLRLERDRGRLVVERIAGKDFTTLAEIDAMRDRCRSEGPHLKFEGRDGRRRPRHTPRLMGHPRRTTKGPHRLPR